MAIAELPSNHDVPPSLEKENPSRIDFGRYLPPGILTNEKIASWGAKSASEELLTAVKIEKKVGVQFRYVASEKETPLLMGLSAAQEALAKRPGKIDVVFFITNFPTGENSSARMKQELGISGGSKWDVHAGCSGFGFSLNYIKKHEEEFLGKRILWVSAERVHPFLQDLRENVRQDGTFKDPALSQTIFSDGAVAMIADYGTDMRILFSSRYKFPRGANNALKVPVDKKLLRKPYLLFLAPSAGAESKVEQDGRKVYELMRDTIPSLIRYELKRNSLLPADIPILDLHQGSRHMVRVLAELLPEFSVARDYEDGNKSSGAILEIWRKAHLQGEIKKGDKRLVAVFGAGLLAVIAGVEFG